MRPLERTTVWTGVLTVAVILALFSPLADPARLSVADQVARLQRGAVTPDRFDYRFLRFESGKAGQAALERLTRSTNSAIADGARKAGMADRYGRSADVLARPRPTASDIKIQAYPSGATLPASFNAQYGRFAELLGHCDDEHACAARLIDLDADGSAEILVAGKISISVFKLERDGRWFEWATYRPSSCLKDFHDIAGVIATGQFETVPPIFPDLVVGGIRLRRQEGEPECPVEPDTAP